MGLDLLSLAALGVKHDDICELRLSGSSSPIRQSVDRALLYWNHPVDATRVSFKLGLGGLMLGILSVSIAVYPLVRRMTATDTTAALLRQVLGVLSSSASAPFWSTVGLVLNAIGVVLLYRFAMPYRNRSDEGAYVRVDKTDPSAHRNDRAYGWVSIIGLWLIGFGTLFQVVGAWLQ